MTTTTYYNLNIVEGTDIVNPLTVDNPNYEKIDEVMHNNAVSGVTLATEIANATVHAIARENSECAVIRFIATRNWKAGDTVTVDGVPVTALLPSGETLPDGAYVINANVLCILTGTNLTVYAERKKIDDATEIAYNGTNVAAAIDKVNSDLAPKNITSQVTLNGNLSSVYSQVCRAGNVVTVTLRNDSEITNNEIFMTKLPQPIIPIYGIPLINSSNGVADSFVNLYKSNDGGSIHNLVDRNKSARFCSLTYICE